MPRTTNYFEHDNRSTPPDHGGYPSNNMHDDYTRGLPKRQGFNYRDDHYESDMRQSNYYQEPMMNNFNMPKPGVNNNNSYNNNGVMYNNGGNGLINNVPSMNNGMLPMMGNNTNVVNGYNGNSTLGFYHNNNNYGNNNRLNNNDKFHHTNNSNFDGIGQTQPQMLSFKQFLANLNNELECDPAGPKSISPEMATKRYNEYKNEFRCEQIGQFFSTHKLEEWFKQRYHPDVSAKRKDEQRAAILRRMKLFMSLLERFEINGRQISLDMCKPMAQKNLMK